MAWGEWIAKLVEVVPDIVKAGRRIRQARRGKGSSSLDALRAKSELGEKMRQAELDAAARERAKRGN